MISYTIVGETLTSPPMTIKGWPVEADPFCSRGSLSIILDVVCAVFDIRRDTIKSTRRDATAAGARQAFMLLAKSHTTCSYPQIGRFLGRDHTTIMYGTRAAQQRAEQDPLYVERLRQCVKVIEGTA